MYPVRSTRSPLTELQAASNRLNQFFDDAFRGFPSSEGPLMGDWIPPVDVAEDDNEIRISAEVPGVKPEDVKITIENNVLTLRGEKCQEKREGGDGERGHRYECSYG